MNNFDVLVDKYSAIFTNYNDGEMPSRIKFEAYVEALQDWSKFMSFDELKTWFLDKRQMCSMTVESISLFDCEGWIFDQADGVIRHKTNEFFRVEGVKVSQVDFREAGKGWYQPIVTQVGFDGGILGLLRKKFDGVPYYLVEAKAEPGNYGKVQISPTLQATFSNINQAHGGRKPKFCDYFLFPEKHGATVHFNQWLAEDGGRLYRKRNRGMLIELPEDISVDLDSGFVWISLWQIKQCLLEDAWINPHVRSIISFM